LMGGDGQRVHIPTSDIKEQQGSSISLMPEGLQAGVSTVEFTDLIEYLVSLKEPGNAHLSHLGMRDNIPQLSSPVQLRPFLKETLQVRPSSASYAGNVQTGLVWFGQVPGFSKRFLVAHQTGMIWLIRKHGDDETQSVFADFTPDIFSARGPNLAGGTSTLAALTLAALSYDILMENGVEAKRAVERNIVTPAVEKVIEANVLLSGLGFESGGCATAHMVANCLPSFPECHGLMHGHEVGFGLITQLCLDDDMPVERIHEIVDFEISVGLPVTFADIGLPGVERERLQVIGDICAGPGSLCANHPFDVSADDIINAMIAADALGEARKKLQG
jgi:hypothetical protein